MKQPITLIIPPSVFLADERVFPSLGLARVAACLEKREYPVEILDLSGVRNFTEVSEGYALSTRTDIFCLTLTTPQLPAASLIVKAMRKVKKEAKFIAGGPHCTTTLAAVKMEKKLGVARRGHRAWQQLEDIFDVTVAGDGEEAVFLAIEKDAPRLIDADDPDSFMFLKDYQLADYPFPARHLLDIHSYKYEIDGHPSTSIISQLGCPYLCSYCSARFSPSFRRVRLRDSDNVALEMETIYRQFGFTGFQFYDDELGLVPSFTQDMQKIINLQDRLGVEFRMRGFIKANLFNETYAKLMYKAGFRQVCVGSESGSDKILVNINKKATKKDNSECIRMAHDNGLSIKCFCSIGHAGEDERSVYDTRDWLIEAKPDDFDMTVITCYPGTPYHDLAIPGDRNGEWVYTAKNGDRLYSVEVDFALDPAYYKGIPGGGYKSFVWTDSIPREKMVELRDEIEKDVRVSLGIPFCSVKPGSSFEHSMGQGFPRSILRSSSDTV